MSEETVPEKGERPRSLEETNAENPRESEAGQGEDAAEVLARDPELRIEPEDTCATGAVVRIKTASAGEPGGTAPGPAQAAGATGVVPVVEVTETCTDLPGGAKSIFQGQPGTVGGVAAGLSRPLLR
jgi:hypothetical protein